MCNVCICLFVATGCSKLLLLGLLVLVYVQQWVFMLTMRRKAREEDKIRLYRGKYFQDEAWANTRVRATDYKQRAGRIKGRRSWPGCNGG